MSGAVTIKDCQTKPKATNHSSNTWAAVMVSAPISAQLVDITILDVDAIVNAANEQLAPGGGVCGAIHRAAGQELASACFELGFCPTGEARITPGFKLPARFVIHAVGPIWRDGSVREAEQLASTYRASLRLAQERGLKSISFPAISTGIYGYPLESATKIAVSAVREALARPSSIDRGVFSCFDTEVLDAYLRAGITD
jgi:O-acetyl-ADP-ribose deacetylase (regulator of RNase III)